MKSPLAGSGIPLGHLGYWGAATVIALMGWTLYSATVETRESGRRVERSLQSLQAIGMASESISRAEAAQRGFLLTGDEGFATERERAIVQVQADVRGLAALDLDPAGRAKVARIQELAAARIDLMHQNARRKADGGNYVASMAAGAGRQASGEIFQLTAQLKDEENARLAASRIQEEATFRRAFGVLIIAVLLSLTVMIPGYIAFSVEARARRRAERLVVDMADSLPGASYRLRTLRDGKRRFEFLSATVGPLRGVDRTAALADFNVMWETIHEEDRAHVAEAMAAAERDLAPVRYDFRVRMPDGAVRWLRASATLRREHDGSVLWNGYWADVTGERRLYQDLEDARDAAEGANRAKSVFLATMSHEIRTPMNGVLGMLELLSHTRLDAEQRTSLEIVRDSGRSLLRIIDDILDFSKIEAGKLDVRPEVASVSAVVEAVYNIYSGNASSKGILLTRSVDKRISPAVVVDPLRLQQILNNLVSNAIKFTAQGYVEIEAELEEHRGTADVVRFTVTDTGIGISLESQKQLFKPFTQAVGDTTRRFGGTGLGLSICRRLADLMGGTIEVASALGSGTRVSLVLPMEIADEAALPKAVARRMISGIPLGERRPAPTAAQAERDRSLVLVADDNAINRMVLMRQVKSLGYATEVAEDGAEALEKWRSGRFSLVITDCNMPAMSGYDLARNIRVAEAASGAGRVPIIACTANAMHTEAENCFAAGMDDYLAKPVELAQLARKLDHWLPLVPHAAAPAAETCPIDPAPLAELSGGDEGIVREIFVQFRAVNDNDAGMLRDAVRGRDLEQVVHFAHRIKGAGRTVGANELGSAGERIEDAAREGDWTAIDGSMAAFDAALDRVNVYLASRGAAAPVAASRKSA